MLEGVERVDDAAADAVFDRDHAVIDMAANHFIEHAGIEELDIGILKDESHSPPEVEEEGFFLQALRGEASDAGTADAGRAPAAPGVTIAR